VHEVLYEEASPAHVIDVDARAIAEIVLQTGAGRRNAEDAIDPAGGISGLACPGDLLEPGQVMARIHHDDKSRVADWEERLRNAVRLSDQKPVLENRIRMRIS